MATKRDQLAAIERDRIFTAIAREHLTIETLEERRSDSLDFHEVSVWGLKRALEAAYEADRATRPK